MQNWARASSAVENAGGTAPFTALQRGMCLKCCLSPDLENEPVKRRAGVSPAPLAHQFERANSKIEWNPLSCRAGGRPDLLSAAYL